MREKIFQNVQSTDNMNVTIENNLIDLKFEVSATLNVTVIHRHVRDRSERHRSRYRMIFFFFFSKCRYQRFFAIVTWNIGLFERKENIRSRMDKARDCGSSRDASSRAKVYF